MKLAALIAIAILVSVTTTLHERRQPVTWSCGGFQVEHEQKVTQSGWRPYRYSGDAEALPLGRGWEAKRGVDY